jgi:sulfite exporter TauE/SafE
MPFIAPDNKETLNLLLSFFILGVVASLTSCTTIVGGIITALSRKWASNQQKSLIIKFHFGRLISFLVFGTILGLLGGFFQISINIMSFFTIIISLLMIIIGLQILQIPFFKSFSFTNLSVFLPKLFKDKLANKRAPYYFGGLTFFIPCGFTLIAQSMAVIGTLPSLIILSLTGYLLGKRSELSDAFSILTSIAIIIFSLYTINSQLNVLGFLSINDFLNNDNKQIFGSSMTLGSKIINSSEGQKQNITVLAKEFEYYPPALKLKADVKSTLTVISQNVEGCAQAMWLGGMHDKPIYLASTGKTQFEFVPRKGKYKISCTMGMVSPITVTVE